MKGLDLTLIEQILGFSLTEEMLAKLGRQELLDLIDLTSRWTQPTDHKFHLYRPAPVLEYYHKSEAKCRVVLGGNRSSKTFSLVEEFAMQFLGEEPESLKGMIPKHRLARGRRLRLNTIDYPNNFAKVVWLLIQQLIPADKISDVVKEQGRIKSICNPYGGFIEFMQYEQDVRKHQGSSRHVIGYDEEPPLSIRDESLMRLADCDGEECFALTPVSEIDRPVLWIHDELYAKASRIVEKENNVMTDVAIPEGDPNIHVFFSNIFDNPGIKREAAERILSLFPAEERTVREKGKFLFMSGRIYKDFNDATHLIPQFDWWKPEYDMTLYIAIDTHPRTPTHVLFLGVDKYNNWYLVEELFIPLGGNLRDFVDKIKALCMGKKPQLIIIEPGSFIPDPATGVCLAYSLMDAGLNDPMPIAAPKDLSNGIIQTRIALSVPTTHDGSIGIPRLRACRHLSRWRYEICHYVWDSYKKDTALTKGEKQKPLDKDDHSMENMYRLVLMNPQYVPSASYDEEERIRQGEGRSKTTGY